MRTSALDRAEQDIERGDYGLARQRLTSYLSTGGYDADVMAKIGRISHDMRDLFQAGRFWLLSLAEGSEVEEAVANFVEQAGSEPRAIVGQLPRVSRLPDLDDYPHVVQERLRRFGLDKEIVRAGRAAQEGKSFNLRDGAIISGCLVVVLCILGVFVVGVIQIGSWLFGD
jgi:hypothetical protein